LGFKIHKAARNWEKIVHRAASKSNIFAWFVSRQFKNGRHRNDVTW